MQHARQLPYQFGFNLALLALAVPLWGWVSHAAGPALTGAASLAFWHTVVELFSVAMAMLIFVAGQRAVFSARKEAVGLGMPFLGVGLLDAMHLLSHPGLPDALTPNIASKFVFFELAARLLAAVAMFAYALKPAVLGLRRAHRHLARALLLLTVGAAGLVGLFGTERLPALIVPGQGWPPLKTGLEGLATALNLATLAVFWRRRRVLAQDNLMTLAWAALLSAAAGLFFMQPQPGAEAIGHVYQALAYLLLLHATLHEAPRRPLERLRAQYEREHVRIALAAAPDGVLWVDNVGKILMANPAMETLTGYPPDELEGRNVDIFLPEHLRERHAQAIQRYFRAPHARAMGSTDLQLMRRDGRMLPVDIALGSWPNQEAPHAIAYIRDLTERKNFEESLRHQSTHDELTGLPNRRLFHLQLRHALAHARRTGRCAAVLLLDLDDFKAVNDSFGHATGDELLVHVGARLQAALRENDTLARLGGDEFALLLPELDSPDEAVHVANRVLSILDATHRLQQREVHVGGSIGLAFFPDNAQDGETLLRYADMAMYQAKQAGRSGYACYSAELGRHARDSMQLHVRLKEAIQRNRLTLHYQPQVEIGSGRIVGAEALLRWQDEILGEVPPARFIPLAETTGLIQPLSDWVLETACQQIAEWQRAGHAVRVAVNFSTQQFRPRDLADRVRATLARTGASGDLLEIEITESMAIEQPEQVREQLKELVALGCRAALDDFGTGYSSLAYLKALPVSKLKIDRSFIKDIPHDPNDIKIARSIIALAHSLGLTVVAEGVESDAQLAFLRQYGCEAFQGWLHSPALPATDLAERFLKSAIA